VRVELAHHGKSWVHTVGHTDLASSLLYTESASRYDDAATCS